MASTVPSFRNFLAPRYWPTWVGISLLCLLAWLPFRLRIASGRLMGLVSWLLARERRYITEVNIRLCFPELNSEQQANLVRRSFQENSIGLIETACGWIRPAKHFSKMVRIIGCEHMDAALAQGHGVLLIGAHYSTLDFGANLLSLHYPFAVTYRPHRNALFDAFMLKGRLSNCNGVFDRNDIRGAFRHLRQGKILWYAPDQDYGPEQAVYVPFFGQQAATITATSRFAAFNSSPVLFVRHHRITREKLYELELIAAEHPIPGSSERDDAQLINKILEQAIRIDPAQYLWMHKRFKTRPGGKPDSPYILISTPLRKLDAAKYGMLTTGAQRINASTLLLQSGLQLRCFDSLPGFRRQKHPAFRLDRISKHLRANGINTITTDSIFLVRHRHMTAITCHLPAGTPLQPGLVSAAALAEFLFRLHACGCNFTDPDQAELITTANGIAILDPLALQTGKQAAAPDQRLVDLVALGHFVDSEQLACAYLALCDPGLVAQLAGRLTLPPTAARQTQAGQPGSRQ